MTTTPDTRSTTVGIVAGARASALVESDGAEGYHAIEPDEATLAEYAKLLDMEPVDALIHFMVPLIYTVSRVVERTAEREHILFGNPRNQLTVQGISAALTMSLSDFMIAIGDIAGIETPQVDELRAIMEREAKAGNFEKFGEGEKPKLELP